MWIFPNSQVEYGWNVNTVLYGSNVGSTHCQCGKHALPAPMQNTGTELCILSTHRSPLLSPQTHPSQLETKFLDFNNFLNSVNFDNSVFVLAIVPMHIAKQFDWSSTIAQHMQLLRNNTDQWCAGMAEVVLRAQQIQWSGSLFQNLLNGSCWISTSTLILLPYLYNTTINSKSMTDNDPSPPKKRQQEVSDPLEVSDVMRVARELWHPADPYKTRALDEEDRDFRESFGIPVNDCLTAFNWMLDTGNLPPGWCRHSTISVGFDALERQCKEEDTSPDVWFHKRHCSKMVETFCWISLLEGEVVTIWVSYLV